MGFFDLLSGAEKRLTYQITVDPNGFLAVVSTHLVEFPDEDYMKVWTAHFCKMMHALGHPNSASANKIVGLLENLQFELFHPEPDLFRAIDGGWVFTGSELIGGHRIKGEFYAKGRRDWYVKTHWGMGIDDDYIALSIVGLFCEVFRRNSGKLSACRILAELMDNLKQIYSGGSHGALDIPRLTRMAWEPAVAAVASRYAAGAYQQVDSEIAVGSRFESERIPPSSGEDQQGG